LLRLVVLLRHLEAIAAIHHFRLLPLEELRWR
jgi:hypothetical protein